MIDLSRWMRPLAWASLVANIGIVVTGGAVRLTGSGLGCPTWPRCTDESFRPHGELGLHGAIEFGNRMLTFVLVAVAVATFIAAWQTGRRRLRVLAFWLAFGVPAQAIIGGITVLTDLNSWLVALHLMLSMVMVATAVLLLRRLDDPGDDGPGVARWTTGRVPTLAWLVFAAGWVVLYLGTVVTGAGPHAGDAQTERNGLDPVQVSQLHADAVFLFVGLTIGLLLATRTHSRAVAVLLGVQLGQGAIGFVQYFTDLPEILVGFHLLGAALTAAAMTWAVLDVVLPAPSRPGEAPPWAEARRDEVLVD
ncbi:COX15/CtaA family protein [Nocardioides litoris]|uniref:COX15/CtaA family protein n=1 Tax=Nocardioides litoris TaxID=1926648 RepID=UPI001FEBB7BC|nr:COX15/CtaA family protein [Nocardioides litoris]